MLNSNRHKDMQGHLGNGNREMETLRRNQKQMWPAEKDCVLQRSKT